MTPKQRIYVEELNKIERRFGKLEDETLKGFIVALQTLRKNMADLMSQGGVEAGQLNVLIKQIDQILSDFDQNTKNLFRGALSSGVELGRDYVFLPLDKVLGRSVIRADLGASLSQINASVDYSVGLIGGLTSEMNQKIADQIRLTVLTNKSPFEVMKAVTKILGTKSSDGVWGTRNRPELVTGVAGRAEAIVRTELTRLFNLASHSQLGAIAAESPEAGIRKRWIASVDKRTRPSHLRTHAETAANPIPIGKPFDVGGYQLMYPGDPAGPASETVHCRCRLGTVYPDIGFIQTDLDRAALAAYKAR